MRIKKIHINESQKALLSEGLSNVIYHFTSLSNGYNICREDKIYLQSAFAKDADNYDKKRKYYLSCTRIKSGDFGYSKKFSQGGVRIVLDGDMLSARFKGKPINYWNGLDDKYEIMRSVDKMRNYDKPFDTYEVSKFKKENPNASKEELDDFISRHFNNSAQHHISNESEDRLFSYEPVINQVHKYILSIDVLLPDLFNNDEYLEYAQAFKSTTMLQRYIKIFDSVKEFDKPNGKDVTEQIEYRKVGMNSTFEKGVLNCLESVIGFISFGNGDFEGKKFGSSTMRLLKEYGLDEFKGEIGRIRNDISKWWYGLNGIIEKVDSIRRELSDEPSKTKSKILKMFTDYLLSIGANSFRDGCLIKKKMAEDYYSKLRGGYASSRIDTLMKERLLVNDSNYTLVLYPNKERFCYVMNWDEDTIRYNAEAFAYDAFNGNAFNHSNSKNENSLRTYIHKLFRKGSVIEVLKVLNKIGFDEDYLKSFGIDFKYKDLDYYDATRYHTANANHADDYMKRMEITNNEVEEYFKEKQNKAI